MDPFIERFLDEIDDNLADPSTSKRLPNSKRIRDLYVAQTRLYERLLNGVGQECSLGRCEADVVIRDGVDEYPLPPLFRQWIQMEYREDGDPNVVTDILRTIDQYDPGPGCEIIDDMRGFKLRPCPDITADQTWTLVYLKGPVLLHYATAARAKNPHTAEALTTYTINAGLTRVTKTNEFTAGLVDETVEFFSAAGASLGTRTITAATVDYIEFAAVTGLTTGCTFTLDVDWCWLVAGTPGTDAGEIVSTADYYNGSALRIYSATTGDRQVKRILDYYLDTSVWTFKLRDVWDTLPTGTVKYEICPEVPEAYDSIYAMDVAILNTGRRSALRRRAGLKEERNDLFHACLNSITSNTMDRAPARTIPARYDEVDPYE